MKNKFLVIMFAILTMVSEKAFNQTVPAVKYRVYTYDPQHPHVNPFKMVGQPAITWAVHNTNVDANRLYYFDPVVRPKWSYLNEAAYCMNFNITAIGGHTALDSSEAQWILQNGTPVIRNIPAGQLLVLGIDPSTNKLACFLNPEYHEVSMIEYTAPNGTSIYISKYSGEGKECCINLVIDLAPRMSSQPPTAKVIHDEVGTTVVNNYYDNRSYSNVERYDYATQMWQPAYIPSYYPSYFCPIGCGMSMWFGSCGCSPSYCCNYGGRRCEVYPVNVQTTNIYNNYTNYYNTTYNTVTPPTPPNQTPPTPRGTNTGGGGSTPGGNNNNGGGGDPPGGRNTTGGGGTNTNNTGGSGKKEWVTVPPEGWNKSTTATAQTAPSGRNGALSGAKNNSQGEWKSVTPNSFKPTATASAKQTSQWKEVVPEGFHTQGQPQNRQNQNPGQRNNVNTNNTWHNTQPPNRSNVNTASPNQRTYASQKSYAPPARQNSAPVQHQPTFQSQPARSMGTQPMGRMATGRR
jgi:hypothetical protein